ncbi:glycine N-acyltransferase-like protein 3 [Portunus trituberculatus]|nr:glycine N-acyltransferase-like protein 3 [Portunus trituberculatus]
MDNICNDITHFPSFGIRQCCSKDDGSLLQEEAQGRLVSWVHLCKIGSMGNTFTMPQHRHRGLASTATLALACKLLQEGLLPYVYIGNYNTASISLHEGLGFKQQCEVHTINLVLAEVTDQDYRG